MSDDFNPTDEQVMAWAENLSEQQKEEAKNQAMYNRWLELQKPKRPPDYNDDRTYAEAIRNMPWSTNG